MVFSSPVFLFLFLPVVLALHLVLGQKARNGLLLLASLVFYAWGEGELVLLLLGSAAVNHALGRAVARARDAGRHATSRRLVAAAVVFDIGLLVFLKYAPWILAGLATQLDALGLPGWRVPRLEGLRLPLGVSFFTFQALSYVIDVHRGTVAAAPSLLRFSTYLALFPQLVAGPIVRYRDVDEQLEHRRVDLTGFSYGVRRFVVGLAKKLLIADALRPVVDEIFAVEAGALTPAAAWLGVIAFGLQIYFDFSGYSDMAIGIGRMLGIRLFENFRHPYVACSVREFWQRWHISLSTWFRDYVYLPLGGNRTGRWRTFANIVMVFGLVGLWHGASLTFVAAGLMHGLFLGFEHLGLDRKLERLPRPLRHGYLLFVVLVSWAFFRADDLGRGAAHVAALFGLASDAPATFGVARFLDGPLVIALVAGVVGSMPWLPWVAEWRERLAARPEGARAALGLDLAALAGVALLLAGSAIALASGTFQPFVYFRF